MIYVQNTAPCCCTVYSEQSVQSSDPLYSVQYTLYSAAAASKPRSGPDAGDIRQAQQQ